jgi:VCBS repeat-containing protein
MIDAELSWHLLLTTTGTEPQRTIRINPAVDLPDEIHPIYADDDLALVRATAGIDGAAHYIDDLTVSCPIGLGAGLGDIASVPVGGVAIVGQVESITWAGTPNGVTETAVTRRHVAIAPAAHFDPVPVTPPTVADDEGETAADAPASGNVLTNDAPGLMIVAVNGLSANVGEPLAGSNGGVFSITSGGAWTFDPDGDFAALSGSETADTSVAYHASDGASESSATLTITVRAAGVPLWTPADIATAQWFSAKDTPRLVIDEGEVAQILDKSGNARNASRSVVGARPIVSTAKFGGRPSLYFDGGDALTHAFALSALPVDFFAVIDAQAQAAGYRGLYSTHGVTNYTQFNAFVSGGSANFGTFGPAYYSSTVNIQNAGPRIVHLRRTGPGGSFAVNGVAAGSFANSYGQVGHIGGSPGGQESKFYLAELVVVAGNLGAEDLGKMMTYLTNEWGL